MDFSLTDEQKKYQKKAREFAYEELLPHYMKWDRNEEMPDYLMRKIADAGLMLTNIPREFGGAGTDRITNGLIVEELAKGDSVLSLLTFGTLVDLMLYTSREMQDEWLPKLVSGEQTLGIALTEPQSGSDAAHMETTAVRKGDIYETNGVKNCVSILNGKGWAFLASTNPEARAKGISMFLLHRDTPGITISEPIRDLGGRAIPRGIITCNDAQIPASHLMGEENMGFIYIMKTFDYNRALIGLMCIGAARQSLAETVEYVKKRKSFGRAISMNQGVSFPLAEADTYLELASNLCYKILWLKDNDLPIAKESAMCKWWIPRICVKILHECILLHGHYGYSEQFPLEQRMRDIIGWETGDGSAQIQKMIITRELIGREFVS